MGDSRSPDTALRELLQGRLPSSPPPPSLLTRASMSRPPRPPPSPSKYSARPQTSYSGSSSGEPSSSRPSFAQLDHAGGDSPRDGAGYRVARKAFFCDVVVEQGIRGEGESSRSMGFRWCAKLGVSLGRARASARGNVQTGLLTFPVGARPTRPSVQNRVGSTPSGKTGSGIAVGSTWQTSGRPRTFAAADQGEAGQRARPAVELSSPPSATGRLAPGWLRSSSSLRILSYQQAVVVRSDRACLPTEERTRQGNP